MIVRTFHPTKLDPTHKSAGTLKLAPWELRFAPHQLPVFLFYRYNKLLEPAERYGRRRGLFTGLGTGFSWVLTYSLNAIGLAYGTRLVLADMALETDERTYQVGDILSVSFKIVEVLVYTLLVTICFWL